MQYTDFRIRRKPKGRTYSYKGQAVHTPWQIIDKEGNTYNSREEVDKKIEASKPKPKTVKKKAVVKKELKED